MLGRRKRSILTQIDQVFTSGDGLTGKGVELLGAKLANMTMGEIVTLIDAKNIDPEMVVKLVNDLRNLALDLYADIIDKVVSGEITNVFKSSDVKLEGDFSFPRQQLTFFEVSQGFLLGGFFYVEFRFSAGCTYGMKIKIGAKIMKMSVYGEAVPYGGLMTTGEISLGFIIYASLRLEGYILTTSFPTRAEIGFSKFPLDIGLTMDVELIPLKLRLLARVLVRIEIPHIVKFEKILFSSEIWEYTTPSIRSRLIDYKNEEKDTTAPTFSEYTDTKSARRKRAVAEPINTPTRHCSVRQLPDRDYTEPAIEISVRSEDDKSQVRLFVTAGTKPGLSDALRQIQLGGQSSIITTILKEDGVPIYFTVVGKNSEGASSTVTCSIPTYDVTLPGGRLEVDFITSSNPGVLKASVVVYEDSELVYTALGVGYGRGIYGDEIVRWTPINMKYQEAQIYNPASDPHGHVAGSLFAASRRGRLIAPKAKTFGMMNFVEACMMKCLELPPSKCLSINYDYGSSGQCELVEAIEGHEYKLAVSGDYVHAERLGIGLAHEFIYKNKNLLHDHMYYFNMDLKNVFGYRNIISTQGVLIDITPPVPGEELMNNSTEDDLETIPCINTIPSDRPEWNTRCIDQSDLVHNHRIIIDELGSRTIFNGHEPLVDDMYFRGNRIISANWDGIHDKESRLLGYSFTAGHKLCEELIHPHHDPHRHLYDESEWTHTGVIKRDVDNVLSDGVYYVTVRALNKVEYGGPLATTICHSTPYIIDNSKPFIHEVFNVEYDEETKDLSVEYNSTDPESGIREVDICLGETTKDCFISDWKRYPHSGQIIHNTSLPGGVPVWTKIRAWNHVQLASIKSSDRPLIIDITPPIAGQVFDGPIYKHDQSYTKYNNKLCANWIDFYDPESGIASFKLFVRSMETDDYLSLGTDYDHGTHQACVDVNDQLLQHNKVYYMEVWAFNDGHIQLNTSAKSNGVIVDLTVPVTGQVVDGLMDNFTDLKYSAAMATISTQWRNHTDPESSIKHYEVKMTRKSKKYYEIETVRDWHELDNSTEYVEYHNFHLKHGDIVRSKLRTTNGALGQVIQETDGYIVDLTPPRLIYLNDGNQQAEDIQYQYNETVIQANFKFIDDESGVDYYKYQVYQTEEGSKVQIFPEIVGTWELIKDGSADGIHVEDQQLISGVHYSVRVVAVNGASSVSTYDTNGFLIDQSPPTMQWVYVGIFSGEEEDRVDGYVYQADTTGIKATWFAYDDVSGIQKYLVSVGTTPGGGEILDWRSFGTERDGYISGIQLDVTKDNSPIYYVSVKAKDGAGLESDVYISTPIIVVDDDKTGIVFDGPEGTVESNPTSVDVDYQRETHTVTVQFSGFESRLHGFAYFDWAIGTTSGGEEAQPFLTAGLHHEERDDISGTSGYGQAVVELESGKTYYTTVRGITNNGHVLESVSDGFTVDISPPVIKVNSISGVMEAEEGDNIYQSEVDSIDIKWTIDDPQSGIYNMYYTVGTYPQGTDVKPITPIQQLLTGNGSLPVRQIQPNTDGKPNIVTIWGENKVGLKGKAVSANLIVDSTPPSEGKVVCPRYIQPHTSLKCSWSGFINIESPIVEFTFGLGSAEGLTDIINPVTLSGHAVNYRTEVPGNVSYEHVYYTIITAKNSVGKTVSAVSDGITVDVTPPVEGRVVELNTEYIINVTSELATRQLNPKSCDTIDECGAIDAVCQESLSSLSIAWSPFRDDESDIVRYEIAVGTTSGGGDIRPYFTVAVQTRHLYIKNLMLMGLSKVYVSVKATNGAGLSTVSVSNGVSLSYISQKLEPLSHIGVWDGAGEHGDIDYQTSVDTIQCSWDVTGDPCPVVQYEWAVERIDGLVVQEFTDTNGRTQGVNDQLELQNDERYICLLRVKNALGFTYNIRSNGVTIEEEPLLPGRVNDGDIEGYDLNFVFTSNKISANWKGFGEDKSEGSRQIEIKSGNLGIFKPAQPDRNQDIEYYEVAVGKDRRFPKTRDSLIPFTNVGLNTSVTFYDLDLVPITATYYFTVRAYSKSMSMAEVTSNGFKIGFNDGVTGGVINMPEFINSNSVVDVQWDGFTSRVGMFMYYLALSSHNEAIYMDCRHFIQVGSMSDNRRLEIFDVLDRENFGKNTFGHLENLNLQQNHSYYVSVIGVDMAGLCKMINHKFHVDITPPSNGKIKIGPYYDMKMAFVSTSESIIAKWKDFTDMDSGLECYRVSLLEEESCDIDASRVVIIPPIEIDSNYTSYTFLELNLKPERVYIIKLEVENKAGLTLEAESAPVVYDASTPTPGLVVDGTNYKMDAVWSRSTSTVLGSILHLPTADGASCPARHILFSDPEWEHYVSVNNYDSSGSKLNIKYRKANVYIHEDELEIKLAKDDKTGTMVSGAYYRDADMNDGGTYELNLRAADGHGKAVTSIIFWDGQVTQIVDFDYTREPDWTLDVCSCCKINQTDPKCLKTCNCTRFLESKNITKRSADTTISDDSSWYVQDLTEHQREVMMGNNSTEKTAAETPDVAIESQTSCGIQILAGDLQKLVTWCKYKNDLYRPMKSERKLKFDPSVSFNRYTIMFFVLNQDALEGSWCLKVYVNDEEVSDLCGVPHFTTDTKIFMQVRNWKNFLPSEPTNEQEFFNVWTTRAIFKSLIMPPDKNALCRYGKPFRGGTTAIIRFEAGISEMKNSDSIVLFKEVVSPCVPCDKPCDRYVCQSNCSSHQFTQYNISLESLDLQPTEIINGTTKPVPYYLTVKAVLGSGQEAVSSSNGFYIDVTPPVFDEDLMLYIDVDQGNYTPVTYQGSNSTIKSIWSCVDNESMVVEYQWGIGSSPGLLDIQSFISTGENPSGTNDRLVGVLEDNSTYYVTVKCFNGAGLESVFTDMKGVTVLLYPPDIEDVGTNMTAGEPFKPPVTPDNTVKVKEGGTIGCSWTISKDSSLREYDFCVGSSEDSYEDIFPCTWVGYNVSGKVSISDGWLLINDEQFKPIGVYHPNFNDTSPDNASTAFKFEPGRTLFLYMRMCNEARRCTMRLVGSSVVINNNSKVVTSSKGGPLRVNLASNEPGRQKREIEVISIETPTVMKEGQSIILTKMDVQRLAEDYTSDAAIDFLSFITNPSETFNRRNNLHRLLVQRLKNQPTDKYFILTSIGHLEIPGPLIVNIKYNPVDMEPHTIPTLLHWNPVQQKWMLSSRSCQTGTNTEVIDETKGEVWIRVCDTWSNGNEDGDSDVYFSKDTLFAVTNILKHIPNTAPTLISTRHMTMMEDSGTLVYSPRVADEEDDDVKVVIVSLSTDHLGSVNITQSGLLLYLPCKECSGELKIQIRLTEIQSEDIEPKTTDETLTIRVLSTNDAPMVFSLVGNRNILHVDSTEPVTILLEENHKFLHQKNNFTWIFGAYDVDKPDELSVHIDGPLNGSLSLSQGRDFDDVLNCNVNEMTSSCLIMDLSHPVEDMSWLYYVMTYIPNDDITGYDVIKLYVSDHMSVRSDVVTFNMAILNMPCINGGTCQSKYTDGTRYKCQDALRADNFYDYYSCNCTNGWSGVNCQEDVNECQSSPCIWPYVCFDFINEYQCACPIDNPNCDSLVGWMIGLIVVAVVMVITLSFLLFYCLSLRRGRGRWPRVFNRFSLSSRTGCDSKIIPFNPTDIEPGCEANCSTI
ncbi:hypothetical protein SNE40_003784 [Patella caerulea]|uniref:EGF-like domain-containing protein n=1 Tax=Patella caerulea TaxID=87958 RepID=A0AAN8QFP8_PATCE